MDGGKSSIAILLLIVIFASLCVECCSSSEDDMKTYIVYTGNKKSDEASSLLYYNNLLQQVASGSGQEPKSIIQYYKRSFGGFVANLTKEEANKMAGLDGVVSVFPNKERYPLTTKSWSFVGMTQYIERNYYESNIVIGVIDTGIWPESSSFDDKGFGPPPAKWNGTCNTANFSCNNKLIGARKYLSIYDEIMTKDYLDSPRDSEGHGTHAASIAAGNPVNMASMLGFAEGTTRGGVPSARIAVYKVCWTKCFDANILHAFDDAISDGVDLLSVSLGGDSIESIHLTDGISVGAFHAMRHGVLTVVAAGNSGPRPSSLANFSPWTIVVAASTLNRKFVTTVKLGDKKTYEGLSLNTFDLEGKLYPIIYGGDVPNTVTGFDRHKSRFCQPNTLNSKLVKGKIVLCQIDKSLGIEEAIRVGAVALLIWGQTYVDDAYPFPLPTCYLQPEDGAKIYKYIRSTRSPSATIFRTIELNDTLAPMVASFSSRGPNNVTADILKPDLMAPGVNIIASWSPITPISDYLGENRKSEYNIVSGTSMACPHVSGAAAYIKSFHPEWSPAAIRSSLMTTAKQISPRNIDYAEFGYGAGEIDPTKALNPGLIYDADAADYFRFLCGVGFNKTILQKITRDNSTCSNTTGISARDLNYPSFALKAPPPKYQIRGRFHRTVTNVGLPISTYKAIVTAPKGVKISVNPNVLSFTSVGEKKTYVLTIESEMKKAIGSGSLVWDGGNIKVRSPIVVYDERILQGAEQELSPELLPELSPGNPYFEVFMYVAAVVLILLTVYILIYSCTITC